MASADREVVNITHKLLFDAKRAVPTKFIQKNRLREIIYYALCGSCGKNFLQSIANISQASMIYQANSWIKENFRDTFSVEDLAEQRNMSVSQFHQLFKSAVGMGPLQCQKRLRLTEARRLMLDEGANVTQAALDVGYESPSQFTLDYRQHRTKTGLRVSPAGSVGDKRLPLATIAFCARFACIFSVISHRFRLPESQDHKWSD